MKQTEFVFESNCIDPQPGHENIPGDAHFDDHLKAVQMAVKFAEEGNIAPPDLVHETIMRNLKGMRKHAGVYRKVAVCVGNQMCPLAIEIPQMMDDWNKLVSMELENAKDISKKDKKDLVWRLHIAYEYIHPWIDGNGRSGRVLMLNHALLLSLKPWTVKYNARFDYYRRFEKCLERKSWQAFLKS